MSFVLTITFWIFKFELWANFYCNVRLGILINANLLICLKFWLNSAFHIFVPPNMCFNFTLKFINQFIIYNIRCNKFTVFVHAVLQFKYNFSRSLFSIFEAIGKRASKENLKCNANKFEDEMDLLILVLTIFKHEIEFEVLNSSKNWKLRKHL